jgi:HSP20 family protein
MRDVFNFQEDINRVFDRFFDRNLVGDDDDMTLSKWHPQVDISENDDSYLVVAELPGLSKDDVHITFTDGFLKIEGERKKEMEEKETNFHRVERVYGKFCRTFQLPKQVKNDKLSADFKDGILKINLPKADEVKPKEIEVKVS